MPDNEINQPNAQDLQLSTEIHQRYFEAVKRRAEEVKKEYNGKTIIQDRTIADPVKQEQNDENARTCLIAVAINCIKAFGATSIPDEKAVLSEILKVSSLSEYGEVRLASVIDYLKMKGLMQKEGPLNSYPAEIIKGLLEGGVIIDCVPSEGDTSGLRSHAKLLTGIRIENGEIYLREYDPDPKKPITRLVPFDTYIDEVYGKNGLTNSTLLMPRSIKEHTN